LKLGLIGSGISRSSAPRLHRLAADLCGIDATYDLIDPGSTDPHALDAALEGCLAQGYHAVNVTYPFKERAAELCEVSDPAVLRIGAVNTVLFNTAPRPAGFNTDYSGFKRAFIERFPSEPPGSVVIIGAGGVGSAVAFALRDLGAREVRLFDREAGRAARLAERLQAAGLSAAAFPTLETTLSDVDGIANCTPAGMYQYPGTPVPRALLGPQRWVFDAVYTPRETEFLRDARAAGLAILEGSELFFWQGVDAFELFAGEPVDAGRLREVLDTLAL
jgi:shikimate dehydrogenase